ncbi:MAG: diacylglycerol kinase family protein [Brumimicrobium sp.]
MKKSIQFIINPISGVGKKNILPRLIENYLDHSIFNYNIVFTQNRGHATTLAKQAVEDNIDIVCAVGGDGSVNEVGIALINTNTTLAILPTGSGNGLARHLNFSLKLKNAIKNLNIGMITTIDTVSIENHFFLGVAGFGFDAIVAERFDKFHSRGFLSYARLVISEFRKYKGISVRINNEEYLHNLLFCTFANGSQFGNGFVVSPQSNLKDGQFEIVCIKNPSFIGFINLLFRSYFGSIDRSSYFTSKVVKSAVVETKEKYAHIDGEPILLNKDVVSLNCNPKCLKILVTKN